MNTNQAAERRDRADLDEAIDLLSDALSADPAAPPDQQLRGRLLRRVAASAQRHRGLATARVRQHQPVEVARGVTRSELYRSGASSDATRRPGEPVWLAVIELAPGTRCADGLGLAGQASEWLVLRGELAIDGVELGALDHHGRQPTAGEPVLESRSGARVYVRHGGTQLTPAGTARAADAQWHDYAPGIRRRVLWEQGNAVCYIARAANGAVVPPHWHLNDEECLMIAGDLFTGDILLREGDFQLAPAGLDHDLVQAGSDCMVYIRGDAQLQVKS
jgi:hypothetical protein